MALTQRIKELRTRNGLSQAALADRLHVSRQAVTKWEAGRGIPTWTTCGRWQPCSASAWTICWTAPGTARRPPCFGIPWTSPPLSRTSRPVDPGREESRAVRDASLTRPSTPSRGCGPITGCRSSSSGG
ncbi:helix-turn-helix domain-containing protein [Rhodococcus hoagii]|nr:helix-turn-helix domain-containing protein [Prescottella equi]